MAKVRLDVLVAERGLAASQEQAQRLIRAGLVDINGHLADKPGREVDAAATCTVRAPPPFVSRGGEKLAAAFGAWPLDVRGRICIDVGCSTGGFTDCLLQQGASQVHAVDVGKGQLHWKLRQDPRVIVHEGINARYLKRGDVQPAPAFGVIDVSFISLTKVLPAVQDVLTSDAQLVTLIKPQFEAGRHEVGKGGVVREAAVRERVIQSVREFGVERLGLEWVGVVESPLKGPAGNVEYLACWKKSAVIKESA